MAEDWRASDGEVNFLNNVPYGTTHFEKGRTWEYVEPGMWKSIGGSGSGGDGLEEAPDDGQIYASQDGMGMRFHQRKIPRS